MALAQGHGPEAWAMALDLGRRPRAWAPGQAEWLWSSDLAHGWWAGPGLCVKNGKVQSVRSRIGKILEDPPIKGRHPDSVIVESAARPCVARVQAVAPYVSNADHRIRGQGNGALVDGAHR